MAGSVNRIFIIGNVGKDPEVRATRGGAKMATLSVATSESWRDKTSGERKEETQWHRVAVFDDEIATMIEQKVRKGSLVLVQGRMKYRKVHDPKIDDNRYYADVVVQGFNCLFQLVEPDQVGQYESRGPSGPDDYGAKPKEERRFGGYGGPRPTQEEVPF